MTQKHAFFAGSASAFNIRRHLINLGEVLNDKNELHLITTKSTELRADVEEYFKIHGVEKSDSRLSEIKVLKKYLQAHTPDSLTQITQPPIHGTIVGSLTRKLNDTIFIYRYNGDTFGSYRVHNGVRKYRNYSLYNVVGRYPLYRADKCIVLGKHGEEQLTKRGVSGEQIACLPPMIDPDRFRNTDPIQFSDDRTVFGFVGRVSRLKGSETLEKTIPEIITKRPNCKFVFVGEVKNDKLRRKFPDHVEFVGTVPPENVPSYMKGFDALVHPSLTEGIPRAILEALYVSTPVIARDVGDLAEVTDNLFNHDSEFVEMVCDFESLPVDDISEFVVDKAGQKYAQFYNQISK